MSWAGFGKPGCPEGGRWFHGGADGALGGVGADWAVKGRLLRWAGQAEKVAAHPQTLLVFS